MCGSRCGEGLHLELQFLTVALAKVGASRIWFVSASLCCPKPKVAQLRTSASRSVINLSNVALASAVSTSPSERGSVPDIVVRVAGKGNDMRSRSHTVNVLK